MPQPQISRSPDLKRLRDEGYDLEIRSAHLLVKGVPYVTDARNVKRGVLISPLEMAGDVTARPSNHVVYFAGEYPCDKDGGKIGQIQHASGKIVLAEGLVADHSFSNKPPEGYRDYYEKITNYVRIISHPAAAIDPSTSAMTFTPIEVPPEESPFRYLDTASSRAGVTSLSERLALSKMAIVGLGGTGSYILDLIAKTPIKEIHIFDGDELLNHNAFRCPGAASLEDLSRRPLKVSYLKDLYSEMHRNIVAHGIYIDATSVEQLAGMAFVFLAIDQAEAKAPIVEFLKARSIPFIDVGMGVMVDHEGRLGGIIRVTARPNGMQRLSSPEGRIPTIGAEPQDEYSSNIQVADLNALNAALAVIKWKKLFGYYRDLEAECYCTYTIDGNSLSNEGGGGLN